MEKTVVLASCLVIATGLGCAVSDYSLITDNDQVSNGQGSGIVNTNGKAHIMRSPQFATTWPDGTDEMFSLVDQDAAGNRVITTYNNFSTLDEPPHLDNLYCNPDWQGCAIWTASDPRQGDLDPFDGRFNPQCAGARSLAFLIGTSRYYGECGRARMSLTERIELMNMGTIARQFGREGMLYGIDASNTSIRLSTGRGEALLPLRGRAEAFLTGRGVTLDLSNPLLANVGRAYVDFQRKYGTDATHVTVTYNGLNFDQLLGSGELGIGETYAAHLNAVLRRKY